MPKPITVEEFWSRKRVTKNDCWEWTHARHRDGYGEARFNRRTSLAHRVAWELTHGPIPPGIHVPHHCDNPPCFNPDHLFLGTHADNMHDMKVKCRRQGIGIGEANGRARLTKEQVEMIRRLYGRGGIGGMKQVDLAAMFGVNQAMISAIIRRASWQ